MRQNVSRRQALRRIGAFGIGVTGAGAVLGGDSVHPVRADDNYDSPDKDWTKTDQADPDSQNHNYKMAQSGTIGWFGAGWEGEQEGGWQHDFRIQSDVRAEIADGEGAGSPVDWIEFLELGITQGTTDNFYASFHDEYHGVHPSPNDETGGPDYSEAAYIIAETAIGSLKSIAGFAFAAPDLLEALTPDRCPTDNYAYGNRYEYSAFPSDAGFFRWVKPYTLDKSVFDVFLMAGDPNEEAETEIQFTFHIESDYRPEEGKFPSSNSVNTKTTAMGTTLYSPKEGWLVEKIPYKKIPRRAQALGLRQREIQTYLEGDEEPLYYAHEMPIMIQ
jgi:hypothetical protein